MNRKINIKKNIVIGETDKEFLTADFYYPEEAEDLPIVILIHGGGFESGSKEKYKEWGPFLAKSGYATLAINYRLATPSYSTWPAIINDIWAAVNWSVNNSHKFGIEPLKMAMIGDSAGAQLASYFTLAYPVNASFKIRATIAVYGVYNLEQNWLENDDNELNKKLIGQTYIDSPEIYKLASPVNFINEAVKNPAFDTSFFIIWGEKDEHVYPSQSKEFIKKLENAGIDTEYLSIPDKGHLWFNIMPGLDEGSLDSYPNSLVVPRIMNFLNENLSINEVGNFSEKLLHQLKDKT